MVAALNMRGLLGALLVALALACPAVGSLSITNYGAVPELSTEAASRTNVAALLSAFSAANTTGATDRTVLVPPGNFYILNATLIGLFNVSLVIEGTLLLNANRSLWPQVWNDGGSWGALDFEQSSHLTIIGSSSGVHVNGVGYDWWWHVITTGNDVRPHMFVFYQCEYLQVLNLSVINSPQFHFYVIDVAHVLFKNVSIVVEAVQKLLPVFPLNTDGIDPSGTNITIEDCYIENYDDAVAVKVRLGCLEIMCLRRAIDAKPVFQIQRLFVGHCGEKHSRQVWCGPHHWFCYAKPCR